MIQRWKFRSRRYHHIGRLVEFDEERLNQVIHEDQRQNVEGIDRDNGLLLQYHRVSLSLDGKG